MLNIQRKIARCNVFLDLHILSFKVTKHFLLVPYDSTFHFITRYYEFVDTILIVLKKKQSQLSFLHVYHHCVTVWLSWSWLESNLTLHWYNIYLRKSHNLTNATHRWGASFNSLVHVVMYTYYLYSALGHNLWWKKYLTAFQLVKHYQSFYILSM
jgi:hypothetical protein